MTKHVLVPFDGSPLSREALRHAVTEFPDASITVLHVVDLFEPEYGTSPDYESTYEPMIGTEEWYERAETVSQRLFEDARDLTDDSDHDLSTESEIGDPTRIIVEFADEEDVDHIVLGAHGLPEQDRSVFGRTAEIVARRATVPVTLVR